MSHLSWISDKDLHSAVNTLVKRCIKARNSAKTQIYKNVVDPFSCLTVASTFNIKAPDDLLELQKKASALTGIACAIGNFHRNILSSVDGWDSHKTGYDLENASKEILAIIKNKHNTFNSGNHKDAISKLDREINLKGGNWIAYLVHIIPEKRKREVRVEEKSRKIYEIDGASFYTKITGEHDAIHDLFSATLTMLQKKPDMAISKEIESYCTRVLKQSIPK